MTITGKSGQAALIVATWLQNLNELSDPAYRDLGDTTKAIWPCYIDSLQDEPDEAVCIYDTGSLIEGRIQYNGVSVQHEDIQVRVRSAVGESPVAKSKIHRIADLFDSLTTAILVPVAVTQTDVITEQLYKIYAISILSGVAYIGPDMKNRPNYTLNARTTIRPIVED